MPRSIFTKYSFCQTEWINAINVHAKRKKVLVIYALIYYQNDIAKNDSFILSVTLITSIKSCNLVQTLCEK